MADWTRIKSIFVQAVELASEERESYLRRQCGQDGALRAEIDQLLAAHFAAGAFLESPTLPGSDTAADHSRMPPAPSEERFGRYTPLEQIGEGGFGTVYRAQQTQPMRRVVALKVLKWGMDSQEIVRRFEAERHALALMGHPNIAGALDAGSTPDGRPYFVMELVDGLPITNYCDRNRLEIRPRLSLIVDVCNAVQHAHQKSIIHRDIKPSNVLVTEVDGRPTPKVIDFGIAKVLDQRLTEHAQMTEVRHLIGTPDYMSPEQSRLTTVDVDTRTDIYSLGVLLYEVCTGVLPFDSRSLQAETLFEYRRLTGELEPPRPSVRLSRLIRTVSTSASDECGPLIQTIAERRRVSPGALRSCLRGDLDWIIMKCLEKDPEHRYASAGDLARDLERHLNDEVVAAGPPRATYRFRKFARRHRVMLYSSAALAFAVLVGLGLAVSGFVAATTARDAAKREQLVAEGAAGRAELESAKARAVSAFLQEMLASANPRVGGRGPGTTVREMLHQAAMRADSGALAGQPDTEIAIRQTIGAALRELALYDEAERQYRTAIELIEQRSGKASPDYADALSGLAQIAQLRGEANAAELLFRRALDINQVTRAPDDEALLVNLSDLSTTLYSQGRFHEAENNYRRVLEVLGRSGSHETTARADALNNLGLTLVALGRNGEAEECYRAALEMNRALVGPQHPAIATNLDNLAVLLAGTDRPEEAERCFRETLAMRRELFGDHHPDVAFTLHNLAHLLFYRGAERTEIEGLLRESLAILRELHGLAHPDTLTVLNSLVSVLGSQGELEDAEALLLEAHGAAANGGAAQEQLHELESRLLQLYEATGRDDLAARWRAAAERTATSQPH